MYCDKCGRPLDENDKNGLCAVCTHGEFVDNLAIRPAVVLLIVNGILAFVLELIYIIFDNVKLSLWLLIPLVISVSLDGFLELKYRHSEGCEHCEVSDSGYVLCTIIICLIAIVSITALVYASLKYS